MTPIAGAALSDELHSAKAPREGSHEKGMLKIHNNCFHFRSCYIFFLKFSGNTTCIDSHHAPVVSVKPSPPHLIFSHTMTGLLVTEMELSEADKFTRVEIGGKITFYPNYIKDSESSHF
jgi:hypothetical protein